MMCSHVSEGHAHHCEVTSEKFWQGGTNFAHVSFGFSVYYVSYEVLLPFGTYSYCAKI